MFDSVAQVLVLTAVVTAVAWPITVMGKLLFRRRGSLRNSESCCGECDRSLAEADDPTFVVDGIFVCERCAGKLRRRLLSLLPFGALTVVALVALVAAMVGGSSIVGQMGKLGTFLLPFVVPGTIINFVALPGQKRANRRVLATPRDDLDAALPPGPLSAQVDRH